jgi:mRNA-degrading endonuclease toxin of MazEF toxin-antitoxin module
MGRYRRGDVVLALFVFDQYDGFKKRPALVLEALEDNMYNICMITTNLQRVTISGNVLLREGTTEFKEAGVLSTCVIHFGATTIVPEAGIFRKIGEFHIRSSETP